MGKEPHDQVGGTCYANTIATVVRAAQMRQKVHVTKHASIVELLVGQFKNNGADTFEACKWYCGKYAQKYQSEYISECAVLAIICDARPVLARLRFDKDQLEKFNSFYSNGDVDAVMKKDDLGAYNPNLKYAGHAVVIIGYNSEKNAWKVQNSWGGNWAKGGYCFIEFGALEDAADPAGKDQIFINVCPKLPQPVKVKDVKTIQWNFTPTYGNSIKVFQDEQGYICGVVGVINGVGQKPMLGKRLQPDVEPKSISFGSLKVKDIDYDEAIVEVFVQASDNDKIGFLAFITNKNQYKVFGKYDGNSKPVAYSTNGGGKTFAGFEASADASNGYIINMKPIWK